MDFLSLQRLGSRAERLRSILTLLFATAFFAAGVLHVSAPRPFVAITPEWVPHPETVILVTGLCEIAGSIGLLIPRTRRLSGAMLALYALCVWPANMKHAWLHAMYGTPPGWFYHAPRLALQPVIIWACLFAGGAVDWPFRRAARGVA